LSRIGSLFNNWFLNLKRLFHLLIALMFMFLTLAGAFQTFVEWQECQATPEHKMIYVYLIGGFTIFLSILCLYSFAKARSVR